VVWTDIGYPPEFSKKLHESFRCLSDEEMEVNANMMDGITIGTFLGGLAGVQSLASHPQR